MVYWIIRNAVKLWLYLRFRIRVEGVRHIPQEGCILAMNHRSNYDSLLVGVHTPRKMYIMAKEELFKNRIGAWVIAEMGAFPVKRGSADIRSLKHSLKLVEEGCLLSLFIEGTRSQSEEMGDPKKGIGFLVAKSRAPVVPVRIQGASGGWFSRASVTFGPPLTVEGKDYEEIARQVSDAIKRLA
ncbi:lysophospholipid acyltransferase family protein [Paenibacillus caseinilyticus]|uniref:lysophospholipid acyltransferase family protein n=1 Tax=Paenibacillus caseinilyticus TaxID=3098138 RepID=UPI0022B8DE7D|nr:lysophospholipid acyltransferase family protein [Paenibacillus caseinilyticus]MCZ8518650.1 lysophospholipid acyltransferase family protein [Paenibacillus caseinilyticus]